MTVTVEKYKAVSIPCPQNLPRLMKQVSCNIFGTVAITCRCQSTYRYFVRYHPRHSLPSQVDAELRLAVGSGRAAKRTLAEGRVIIGYL